eukprot:g6304.t1
MSFANFAFAFFCPAANATQPYWAQDLGLCKNKKPFELLDHLEDSDPRDYRKLASFKASNPGLAVVLSVGGWNFPSRYFSDMVATAATRATFISSCKAFMKKYQFDGIDLDWEYPCSEPRSNPVKISCSSFKTVEDDGGRCPQDKGNLLALVREMRQALGPQAIITVAAQAAMSKATLGFDLAAMDPYLSYWNLMTYDYSTPDEGDAAKVTAPNMPLASPSVPGVPAWSIQATVSGYIAAGVPADKLVVGLSLYGHTWYTPGAASGAQWQRFGVPAEKQGKCCGPENDTYGAQGGAGQGECGSMMYSEIIAANCSSFEDERTSSTIAFCGGSGGAAHDSYTLNGTWITYNSEASYQKIAQFVKDKSLGGVFVFDASMDTRSNGQYTYGIMRMLAGEFGR